MKASFDVLWPKEIQERILKRWKQYIFMFPLGSGVSSNGVAGKRSSQKGKLAFISANDKRNWASFSSPLTCLIGEAGLLKATRSYSLPFLTLLTLQLHSAFERVNP